MIRQVVRMRAVLLILSALILGPLQLADVVAQEDAPWYLVSGAFGNREFGEIAGVVALLDDVEEEMVYGRPVYTGTLILESGDSVLVRAVVLGVEQGNTMQMVQELYTRYGSHPLVHIHGGINGGYHEVGSSSVPKRVCIVDKFYNYPVLAPQPIWTEEGDTLADLIEQYGWSEEEVETALARNPGKLVEDPTAPLGAHQLVGPRDEAWNDRFISLGITVYMRDGTSVSLNPPCFDIPDDLYAIAAQAAEMTTLPELPEGIADFISEHGRDPAEANRIHYGEDEVLCAGGTFFASPVEAWRQIELFGCDGVDMETPFVAWAVASETSAIEPDVVVFRTSSDPPIFNPGLPFITATEYLENPADVGQAARSSLGPIFALPVVPHQAASYASFVQTFINLYEAQTSE